MMLERQREGIAKAKAAGKYKGQAPTARAKAAQVHTLQAEGVGPSEIARRLGIGGSSVYRLLTTAQRWRPGVRRVSTRQPELRSLSGVLVD
jgi:DNA invertase Pin-like site-specific DNA recombinase